MLEKVVKLTLNPSYLYSEKYIYCHVVAAVVWTIYDGKWRLRYWCRLWWWRWSFLRYLTLYLLFIFFVLYLLMSVTSSWPSVMVRRAYFIKTKNMVRCKNSLIKFYQFPNKYLCVCVCITVPCCWVVRNTHHSVQNHFACSCCHLVVDGGWSCSFNLHELLWYQVVLVVVHGVVEWITITTPIHR